jgi:5,10-methylenetetrahydromethanopterin reductase
MTDLPRGEDWLAAYADIPADVRHLAVHDRHLIGVNDRDRAFVTPEILQAMGATYRPAELRERLGAMAASGMTEIAYQPAGPDIPRELEAFAKAVRG